MNVNDTSSSTGIDASLDKVVIFLKVSFIQIGTKHIVSQELPPDWQTEGVETIILHEMVHLALAVVTIVFQERRPSSGSLAVSVGVAAKIETSNVNTIER